jgi:hypothetical protein
MVWSNGEKKMTINKNLLAADGQCILFFDLDKVRLLHRLSLGLVGRE